MSGLRTRKLIATGLILFSGWLLLYLLKNQQHLTAIIQQNSARGSRNASDYGRLSSHILPPQPKHEPDTVFRQIKDDAAQDSMKISTDGSDLLTNDIPPPQTHLEADVRYLGFMNYAGLTNQFMALENAAYVALRLNRTLILPPITTNSHDKYNSNQRWSEFFDIPRFTALTGVQVVEWNDIRPLTKEQIAVGKRQVHLGGKSFPLWDSLAANLTCQVIYGFGDSERLHTTELTFSRQFLFRPTFVRPPPRNPKTPIFSRLKIGAKDNTNLEDIVTFDDLLDRYEGNQEQLLFLSHTFKLKDPIGGRSWEAVGKHLHFLPKVTDYATRLIRHRAPEAGESGRYIAIHVRRGDIWQKCRAKSGDGMMACITPLGRYVESVEKARQMIGERLPVIVTTDSKSEEDHVTMARMGWRRLDHEMYTTEEELGIFGPAMVDAAILADAEIFIGTYVSSMSRVAAKRQMSWHQRKALYPRTTLDSIPMNI